MSKELTACEKAFNLFHDHKRALHERRELLKNLKEQSEKARLALNQIGKEIDSVESGIAFNIRSMQEAADSIGGLMSSEVAGYRTQQTRADRFSNRQASIPDHPDKASLPIPETGHEVGAGGKKS